MPAIKEKEHLKLPTLPLSARFSPSNRFHTQAENAGGTFDSRSRSLYCNIIEKMQSFFKYLDSPKIQPSAERKECFKPPLGLLVHSYEFVLTYSFDLTLIKAIVMICKRENFDN